MADGSHAGGGESNGSGPQPVRQRAAVAAGCHQILSALATLAINVEFAVGESDPRLRAEAAEDVHLAVERIAKLVRELQAMTR